MSTVSTTFALSAEQAAPRGFSLSTEISLPWRLVAAAIALFGTADIACLEVSEIAGTSMYFGAYGLFAGAATMFINRKAR